jgi:hypothetical protein
VKTPFLAAPSRGSGQAVLEFLIMIPFALVVILGALQLALIFNAQTMMKLAAFNAARAAIVAQGAKPEDPATAGGTVGFLKPAHLAAVITLLPVIPALHGARPNLASIGNVLGGANLDANALGSTAALVELAMIDVEFIDPEGPIDGPAIGNWPSRIDFDDPAKASDNRIKVRVRWDYPLVIPYINRILAAIGNPVAYQLYKTAIRNGVPPTPQEILRDLNKPAWEYGDFLSRSPTGSPVADAALSNLLLRWPMTATYVMRMQWDRKPN